MRVGTVSEIKNHEYRVGLTPESVRELVAHGALEALHRLAALTGQGDFHEDLDRHADPPRIEPRDVALDHALLLQRLDPAMARRRREMDLLRQFRDRTRGIALQRHK